MDFIWQFHNQATLSSVEETSEFQWVEQTLVLTDQSRAEGETKGKEWIDPLQVTFLIQWGQEDRAIQKQVTD